LRAGHRVSLGNFIRHRSVEQLVIDVALESCALQCAFFESLGVGRFHAAVLVAPAMISLLADFETLHDRRARRKHGVSTTQTGNDLFR
jgi:hypothetical protein